MKVKFKFNSPFLVGGIKRVSNYIESLDYISGNVVRAAFAKYILSNCPYYDRDEYIEIDGVKRKNWVYYRDKPQCEDCSLKSLCQKFSDIKFSFFYPEGTSIIPATAMRCKMYPEHGFIDRLTVERPLCRKCDNNDGRVEFVTGYMKDGKDYTVTKSLYTRAAIDKYTGTAKDGMLYSLQAVTATGKQDDIQHNIYEGSIWGVTKEDLLPVKHLRIGKYISVGFGKCDIIINENDVEEKYSVNIDGVEDSKILIENMANFNEIYKKCNYVKDDLSYFAVMLTSDTKLNYNLKDFKNRGKCITMDEYKNIWLTSLCIPELIEDFKIEKVYAEVFNFRGYDTSKVEEYQRKQPTHMVQKGSVIIFKTSKDFQNILDTFTSLDSFGFDTINGFGQFDFYFGNYGGAY
jgi:CRISPR-associated protein Csx10